MDTNINTDQLLLVCELALSEQAFRVHAPSLEIAKSLKRNLPQMAMEAKKLGRQMVEITFPGCKTPFQIPSAMAASGSELGPAVPGNGKSKKQPPAQRFRGIVRTAIELDWNAISAGSNPVYISQLQDQHNLYLNQAAVRAQSGKPPAEFLSATAHALNFEEELTSRCGHLIRDEHLREYSYQALRWCRDESGIWIRKRMAFVSNFWKVSYLGQPCWLGEVLEAQPLDKHLDNS